MSDEPRSAEGQSVSEPAWLLRPEEMPPGVRLQLSTVIEAQELTPDLIHALGQALEGIHKSAKTIPSSCPKLKECGTFKDPIGCPSLTKCGDYTVTTIPV